MAGDPRAFRLLVAGVATFLSLIPILVQAQGAGVVTGHIQDAQGQPLQGVAVTLHKAGKEIPPQTSGTDGNFRFSDLGSGVYSASASMEGFAPVNCPGVRIVASLERYFTIKLMSATEGGPPSTCEIGEPPVQ